MTPIGYSAARLRLLAVVLAIYAIVAAALPFSKVSIDYASFSTLYLGLAPLLAPACLAYRWKASRLDALLDTTIACMLVLVPIIVTTYLAIGVGMPLADDVLIKMDAALGFDWRAFIFFVDARPWLAETLAVAYASFFLQLMLIPFYFSLTGQGVRACAIVVAYVLVCLLSSLISVWFPALGTYAMYGVTQADLANVSAKYGYFFLDSFHAVRDQATFVLNADSAAGILTFPSVHAGVAALCAWGAWGSRVLRWPILALNVAMAASAVSHANHYLVDVLAGFACAAVSIAAAKALFYRTGASRSTLPSPAGHPLAGGASVAS